MTFSRLRAFWLPRTAITPAEWEQFDANLANAIDGGAGGTYAPTNPITIGGDGVEVPGPFVSSGTFTAQDTATFDGVSMASVHARIPGIRTTYEYILPILAHTIGADWAANTGSYETTAASGGSPARFIYIPVGPLPRHQSDATMYLTEVAVEIIGGSGHAALPATMPKLSAWYITTPAGGDLAQIGSTATDSSINVAAYEARHGIFCTFATGHEINLFGSGGSLVLVLENEFGANSQSGLRIIGAKAVVEASA